MTDHLGRWHALLLSLLVLVAYSAPSDKSMIRRGVRSDVVYSMFGAVSKLAPALLALVVVTAIALLASRRSAWSRMPRWPKWALMLLVAHVVWGVTVGLLRNLPMDHVLGNAQFLALYLPVLALVVVPDRFATMVLGAFRWAFTMPALWTWVALVAGDFQRVSADGARIIQDGASYVIAGAALWVVRLVQIRQPTPLLGVLVCAAVPFISGVRSVLLGLVIMATVGLVLTVRWWLKPVVVVLAVGFVLSVQTAPLGGTAPAPGETTSSSSATGSVESSLTGRDSEAIAESNQHRKELALELYREWRETPVVGQGYGYVVTVDRRRDISEVARPYIVELSYNNALTKTGIAGSLLLLAGVGTLLVGLGTWVKKGRPRRERTARAFVLGGFLGLAAASVWNPLFESVFFHGYTGLALVLAALDRTLVPVTPTDRAKQAD